MRQPIVLAAILSIILAAGTSRAADDREEQQYPLGKASLVLSSKAVSFSGQWSAAGTDFPNPVFDGATLRVIGGVGRGRQRPDPPPRGNWKAFRRTRAIVYNDKQGRAGGIKMVQLRLHRRAVAA